MTLYGRPVSGGKDIEVGFGALAALSGFVALAFCGALWGPWFACDGNVLESTCNALGSRQAFGIDASAATMVVAVPIWSSFFMVVGKVGEVVVNNVRGGTD
jgi:hypothetical protein